jgi:uncharacterized phage protein (TIGR01671 family)
MNREIKFRAWDKFTKKMVFEGFNVIGEVTCFNCIEQYGDQHPNPIYETSIARLNDFTLMQYTGLKDKNGKEIYEGDIVTFSGTMCDTAICLVEFYEGRFIFRLDDFSWRDIMGWRNVEILGNIYENPELLK